MATEAEIAQWLITEIRENGRRRSYQSVLVQRIREKFGEEWSYRNYNGNWAIDKRVLREFGKLKDKYVLWDRSNQTWHLADDAELERIAEAKARREEAQRRWEESRRERG